MQSKTPLTVFVSVIAMAACSTMDAASFTPLGFPGSSHGGANGVSVDGTFVGGYASKKETESNYVWFRSQAVRWTTGSTETAAVGLGLLPGAKDSSALGMSADGQVLVGVSGGRAFRWSAAKGMIDLGTMPAKDYFVAWGASGDGSVVVGSGDVGGHEQFTEPFLWTSNTGMKKLGFLTGDSRGEAVAVSKDGQVIVGYSADNLQTRAFRRGPDGVMRALDVLDEYSPTVAHAVSSDGSVVVGETGSWGSSEAFRWSQSLGIQLLGVLEGYSSSEAAAVSGDGALVVGYSSGRKNDKFTSRAFIWDSARGMREIQSILKSQYDLDLPGWTLDEATAISSDGTAIVGEGTNPQGNRQAWIVRITETHPTLSVRRDGTSFKIRWPASFGKYELQSITSFVPSGGWQPVTNAPVLIEGELVVTQFVTDTERFFRLRQQ